jgi:hypothetical protein
MAKKITEQKPKPRQTNYEPKVKFDGTLEEMIKIAVKPIHNKKATDK